MYATGSSLGLNGFMMHTEAVELHPIPIHGEHHCVGLDVLGPWPLERSVSGKLYISTSMEYMTKSAEANFWALPTGRTG